MAGLDNVTRSLLAAGLLQPQIGKLDETARSLRQYVSLLDRCRERGQPPPLGGESLLARLAGQVEEVADALLDLRGQEAPDG